VLAMESEVMDLVWGAKWIGPAYDPRQDLGVFAFRRKFSLEGEVPELRVRVSADNRYKLYCNGDLVGFGPQRGDERHWFYETYDLSPFLQPGENWLTALVWNFGRWAPMGQHTVRTAFVLEGGGLQTPDDWQVAKLEGWDFDMMHRGTGEYYIDVGPGEILRSGPSATVDAVVGEPGRNLSWEKPHVICEAQERGASGGGTPWMLIPRSIPPMRYDHFCEAPLARNRGDEPSKSATLADGEFLLLDYGELLCAYPRVFVSSKGRSVVTLTYDEALWGEDGKGNRNEVEGKESRGYQDRIELEAYALVFEPLWWRTYRYLRLEVSGDPVSILEVEAIETGYPLQVESSFEADDPWVKPIWDVSIRTAERCAGETYFDCPYYEQLQYVGDTRIQALIGYYLGRDRALQRNAVETLGWSIMENGLTQSRYPSRQTQVIPPFSLWWVMMLYDQWLYDRLGELSDTGVGQLDAMFAGFNDVWDPVVEQAFWNFVDWVPEWRWGVPPGDFHSLVHTLLLKLVTIVYEDLRPGAQAFGRSRGEQFEKIREMFGLHGQLVHSFAGPESRESEHAEALWRVLQMHVDWPGGPYPWPTEALAAADAAKCTYYFSYYKHLAMFGREDAPFDYMTELQPWKEMIQDGLTTFAENPEPTRSDCHAWSAHPILGFFQIVAGVTSVAPGWKKARIMPHPGSLKRFDARIAHPDGDLRVRFEGEKLEIDTPIEAELHWRGKKENLKPGRHRI
jgi:alpha-L-rhamnosidase